MNINDRMLWLQPAPDASAGKPARPLPPQSVAPLDAAAVIADFGKRLADLERSVRWAVQGDRVLSQIQISPEAVLIASDKVGVVGEVTFADWIRDVNGTAIGVDPAITQIRGNVIRTGKIYSSDGQSYLDLDATGSSDFLKCRTSLVIKANGTATFAGDISSASGTFTGNVTAGGYVTAIGSGITDGTNFPGSGGSVAVAGYNNSAGSAVYGRTTSGLGSAGVYGRSEGAAAPGVQGTNTAGGAGVSSSGPFATTSSTEVTNLNSATVKGYGSSIVYHNGTGSPSSPGVIAGYISISRIDGSGGAVNIAYYT